MKQRIFLGPVVDKKPNDTEGNDDWLKGHEEASPQIKRNNVNVLVATLKKHVFIDLVEFDLSETELLFWN